MSRQLAKQAGISQGKDEQPYRLFRKAQFADIRRDWFYIGF